MSTTTELDSFVQKVNQLLQDWLAPGAPRTANRLGILAGIRKPTMYGLCNGTSSILKIHPTKIIKLVSILENSPESVVFERYEKYLRHINEVSIDSVIPVDLELSYNKQFTDSFANEMKNPVALKIYTMSLKKGGITASEISKEFGEYGIGIAMNLEGKNILVYTGHKTFSPINHETLNLSRSQIKEIIPTLNTYYNEDHKNSLRNFVSIKIDSISKDALVKIHDQYSLLDQEVDKILASSESRGDIPFYCFSQLDTFNDKID
jgi:hypothetical protein